MFEMRLVELLKWLALRRRHAGGGKCREWFD